MANDFSNDNNCVALWKMEDGALTTDSIGSNTLVNYNNIVASSDCKEGSYSADLVRASSQLFYIDDADLDSGYPLKLGESNKKVSICTWFKLDIDNGGYIYCHGHTSQNKRQLGVYYYSTDNKFKLLVGNTTGTDWEWCSHSTAISTGVWYHIGVTFDDDDRSYKIRIWDDDNKVILGGDSTTGTSNNNLNIEGSRLYIGGRNGPSYEWDGHIDEVAVFNDILTDYEIDQIRFGVYPRASLIKGSQIRPSFAGAGLSLDDNILNTTVDDSSIYVCDDALTASGVARYHGRYTIPIGVSETTIAFPSDLGSTNYLVGVGLQNTTDASPSIYTYMITDTTTSGFTVKFSGDMDSANYVLNWSVVNA